MGTFDDFTDEAEEIRRNGQAGMALRYGVESNPDQVAKQVDLAKRYRLPLDVVKMAPDEFSNRAKFEDAQRVVGSSPKLSEWLAQDKTRAEIAHDTLPQLAGIERTISGTLGDVAVTGLKGAIGLPQSFVGLADIPTFGLVGKGLDAAGLNFSAAQKELDSYYSPAQQEANRRVRQADGFSDTVLEALANPSTILTSVGESLPQMLGGAAIGRKILTTGSSLLPAGVAGAELPSWLLRTFGEKWAPVVASAVGEGLTGAGSMAEQIRETESDGLLSAKQSLAAVGSGIGTGLFAIAGGGLAKKLGIADIDTALVKGGLDKASAETLKKGFLGNVAKAGISEGVFEELPQSVQEQMWQNFATDRPLMEGVGNQAAMGMLAGMATGGAFQSFHAAVARMERKEQQSQQADATYQSLQQLSTLAQAGTLRERSPDAFKSFVEQVSEDGHLKEVFIDGKMLVGAFNQVGITEDELREKLPAVASQLTEALETNGMVRIPTADYLTTIAGGPVDGAILPHLKTDPNGQTYSEAQTYFQGKTEELQQEADKLIKQHADDQVFQAEQQAVYDHMLGQLEATGRFTSDVNKAYATLARDFYLTTAAKMGMTPTQLMAAHPLRVGAENVVGDKYDQAEKTLWRSARDSVLSALRVTYGKPVTVPAANGDQIIVSYRGLRHALQNGVPSLQETALALHIREVIALAGRESVFPDKAGRSDPHSTTTYTVNVSFDGVPHKATIFVRNHRDGNRYYDHSTVEKGSPPGRPESAAPAEAGIAEPTLPSSGLDISLDEVKRGVNGELYQGNRGAYNPDTGTIALLKGADLSTFLHELGHHFLEMTADLASQVDAPPAIQQDFQKLLDWFGIKDAAEWHSLDLEEKRSYHEKFARGFEAYLFEGKAPSIELNNLFGRFRAWLVSVYKSLAQLKVELTDDVRGVMGRMLASEAAIAELEQVQGYEGLFKTAEAAGMTPEQFAEYQALGREATTDAVDRLERRSLRDMQWASNAKSKVLKLLQAQAADARREVRAEVASEVWQQQVYQVWQFLTSRENLDGSKGAPPKKVVGSKSVDPTRDTLFEAIAKLGGMDKKDAASEWGLDTKDVGTTNNTQGKRVVLRDRGGLSVDGMAEQLAQYGYLTLDEHGKWDLKEFEEKFGNERSGSPEYSAEADYDFLRYGPDGAPPTAGDVGQRYGGRLNRNELRMFGDAGAKVEALKMARDGGLPIDAVAEQFGYSSGDEMIQALANAQAPNVVIEGMTDQRMLEQHGELTDAKAIERAAEAAIHNEVRARFMATGLKMLTGSPMPAKQIAQAAKIAADRAIAAKRVRDIRPSQYTTAEARANRNAIKAAASDPKAAAVEQRAALLNNRLAMAAMDALEEVRKGVKYLKKFDKADIRKSLDADYVDQIEALLDRFDLRQASNKAIDKRASLVAWVEAQRDAGIEPDISEDLLNEAYREHFKNLTIEQFRGLVDTVKQIEHLGRLKHKLLTAADKRAYEIVRDEIAASIHAHAQGRQASTRTPTTNMGRAIDGLKRFFASHRKAAMLARTLDGDQDGGPMWEYFVRNANERGDQETTMRAEATKALTEILAPVFKLGKMGGAGMYFPAIKRSLNREARLAIALNVGNEGNLQRLLGGEGWSMAQLKPILDTITAAEWRAVQAIWNHFESYRPLIGAKEKRVYGKEPEWVAPGSEILTAIAIQHQLPLAGGYYPIKYDPAASQRAEEHADAEGAKRQLQGAYTSATTRRSFTKSRVEEVNGRPLLYSLAGLYGGVNDVIHDLSWHEWLIDANRLMRSTTIDTAIREHYGPETKSQFKEWIKDVAEGERGATNAGEAALSKLRQGVSAAGLGFNVVSAIMQPLGITQSIVRVGGKWVGKGIASYIAAPVTATRKVNDMSSFMANRARTRLRELNELRNKVQDETAAKAAINGGLYFLMMRFQQAVDVPTWLGAYEKASSEGNNEERCIALADQAVIDSQGGGMTKDLAAIERGGPALKLFTVFYSFMNTAYNLGANSAMSPKSRAKKAADLVLIGVLPPLMALMLKQAITPGGDDDQWDMEKLAKRLLAAQLDYMMGLMVVAREFSEVAKTLTGANDLGRDYSGPAGLRLVADAVGLAKQVHQGEFDDGFRKAAINVVGDLFGLPAAQTNRIITGAEALHEGSTSNPAALVFGYQKPH